LICYEGIFPRISREYKNSGVGLLVNITNDAWFGTSSAPYQHLTMAAFRAVENHVYMIRAANTGISAIIGPTGEVVSRTGLFERTSLNGKVQFLGEKTFYSKYGDVFACLCFIFLAIIFLRVEITGTRRKFNDRRYFAGNQ
jgi:apolipoprotein N-acyltransferase